MQRVLRRLPLMSAGMALIVAVSIAWHDLLPTRSSWAAAPPDKADESRELLDPAAWGSDHVDDFVPEFIEAGECLFCHRNEVGASWATNRHNRTIRGAAPDDPAMEALVDDPATAVTGEEVELLLGGPRAARYLKRSEAYGKVDILSVHANAGRGTRWRVHHAEEPHWDADLFAQRCAGCHTSAVDPEDHSFVALALDCFTCHGDAPLEHSNDATLMPLARERQDPARVVISICGSCHIRFGTSQASGLPYPTNFVAGDNLFRDFQFDFDLADDESINPGDRHVLDNVRMVALEGREDMTCLSCHEVHTGSSARHRDLPRQAYCIHCHDPERPLKFHRPYEVHSDTCDY